MIVSPTASRTIVILIPLLEEHNFFDKVIALDPTDEEYVENVGAAKVSLAAAQSTYEATAGVIAGPLKIGAAGGWLVWHKDGRTGKGSCDKKGAGSFVGSTIPKTVKPGQFKLYLPKEDRKKCTLDLVGGYTWKASGGYQKGLSNRSGPWTGKYS